MLTPVYGEGMFPFEHDKEEERKKTCGVSTPTNTTDCEPTNISAQPHQLRLAMCIPGRLPLSSFKGLFFGITQLFSCVALTICRANGESLQLVS